MSCNKIHYFSLSRALTLPLSATPCPYPTEPPSIRLSSRRMVPEVAVSLPLRSAILVYLSIPLLFFYYPLTALHSRGSPISLPT